MLKHGMFLAITLTLAFMSWITGTCAQNNHSFVELGFYVTFLTLLAVVAVAWVSETIGIWGPGLVTIKSRD